MIGNDFGKVDVILLFVELGTFVVVCVRYCCEDLWRKFVWGCFYIFEVGQVVCILRLGKFGAKLSEIIHKLERLIFLRALFSKSKTLF